MLHQHRLQVLVDAGIKVRGDFLGSTLFTGRPHANLVRYDLRTGNGASNRFRTPSIVVRGDITRQGYDAPLPVWTYADFVQSSLIQCMTYVVGNLGSLRG